MLVLGLVLIIAAAVLGVGVVIDGSESSTVEMFGTSVDTTVAGVFFTGAGTMLVLLIGVWLLTASMGRARRKRSERKEAKRRQRDSVSQLEEERTQLRAENERLAQQLGHTRTDDDAIPADEGGPAATETRTGAPMRESDGPAATGQGNPVGTGGTAGSADTDLRGHETTPATGSRSDTGHRI